MREAIQGSMENGRHIHLKQIFGFLIKMIAKIMLVDVARQRLCSTFDVVFECQKFESWQRAARMQGNAKRDVKEGDEDRIGGCLESQRTLCLQQWRRRIDWSHWPCRIVQTCQTTINLKHTLDICLRTLKCVQVAHKYARINSLRIL